MDRIRIAALVLVVATFVAIAAYTAPEHEVTGSDYTVTEEFLPGDYIRYHVEIDGEEGTDEFIITGNDPETGLFSADYRYYGLGYAGDGRFVVTVVFDNKLLTGQEVINGFLDGFGRFYNELRDDSSVLGGTDPVFRVLGQQTVGTENFGRIRCTVYEGSFYVPDGDMTERSVAWIGDNGMLVKQESQMITPEKTFTCKLTLCDGNLYVHKSDNHWRWDLDPSFTAGDFRIAETAIGGETFIDKMRVTAYDGVTGRYTVENDQHVPVYDEETGGIHAELITETLTLTPEGLKARLAPAADGIERTFYEMVERTGGTDAQFSKYGRAAAYTEYYGNMDCVRYDGRYYDSEASVYVTYMFWLGDNDILAKQAIVFDDDYDNISTLSLKYSSNIVLEDMPLVEFEFKDELEVGDYYWIDNTETYWSWYGYDSDLQGFYDLHFKYDISDMAYLYSICYMMDGRTIVGDIYGKEGVQVCFARDSGIQLYFEYFRENEVELVKTVSCSADLSKEFTPEDIEAGLTFQKTTTRYHVEYFGGEPQIREIEVKDYLYEVTGVEDDVVHCELDFDRYVRYVTKYGIASIDGDGIVTETGQSMTREEYFDRISKDRLVNTFRDSFEVTDEEHSVIKIWSEDGTTMADLVHLEGVDDYYEGSLSVTYLFGDIVIEMVFAVDNEYYSLYQTAYLTRSNLW